MTQIKTGSINVWLNGEFDARVLDECILHPGGKVVEGSSTVLINNRPAARVGDKMTCGCLMVIEGSSNVFVGGLTTILGMSASDYQAIAEQALQPAGDNVFKRNQMITAAYADLYLSDSETFKWAGMAAIASKEVGRGMGIGEALSESGLPLIPGVPGARILGSDIVQWLATGNKAMYEDIYWQHLAYQNGGIAELERIRDANDINPQVFQAWQKIDRGKRENNQDLIWEGNGDLLRFEQRDVLQPKVYDQSRQLWSDMSGAPAKWFMEIESPYNSQGPSFQDFVDGGDLGNFDDRWKWINGSLLPEWKQIDANQKRQSSVFRL